MKYSEISHFSHHHNLKLEDAEAPFKCDGCKEAGIGSRYKCGGGCFYELHTHCAVPYASISHPFYRKCSFQLSRVPGEVVGEEGRMEEFRGKVTVAEVLSGHPSCFLCSSDSMVVNSVAPQIPKMKC